MAEINERLKQISSTMNQLNPSIVMQHLIQTIDQMVEGCRQAVAGVNARHNAEKRKAFEILDRENSKLSNLSSELKRMEEEAAKHLKDLGVKPTPVSHHPSPRKKSAVSREWAERYIDKARAEKASLDKIEKYNVGDVVGGG